MELRHKQYKKNERTDNYLRAAEFRYPKWIPCSVSIMPATWKKYREDVEKIVLDHPKVFPGYKKGARNFDDVGLNHREGRHTDNWECVWDNIYEGLAGQVVGHPLENWDALETYEAPDPLTQGERGPQVNWESAKENIKRAKQNGNLAAGGLSHGFMFMRLFYLRGFENLMIDIATGDPRLRKLIDFVLDHNMKLVNKWLELGVEMVSGGDDLGTQKGLPISPRHFQKYLTPCYAQIFGTCRDAGALVYLHTDGHIMEAMDDLIECGVTIINPQIRPNTFEELAKIAKGKVCINLDLDRQLFPFATPQEIRDHIRKAIDVLGADEGGLMLHAECAPDVPLENIETICNAFEEWCGPAR
jgi:uroporphyrinogen decarboxylase